MKYFRPPFTEEEIQKQYKELAKEFHPDKNSGSEAIFKDIQSEKESALKLARIFKQQGKKIFKKRIQKRKPGNRTQINILFDGKGLLDLVRELNKLRR